MDSRFCETLEHRALLSASPVTDSDDAGSFLARLTKTPTHVVSTIPSNGDLNPYGAVIVPQGFAPGGKTHAGDLLISNFNASNNLQGQGTTIVSIDPSGHQSLFFKGQKGLGLTTALSVLRNGFVLVGSTPSPDGIHVTAPGSLLIINRQGQLVRTLQDEDLLDGPWDMTVVDHGSRAEVFVSNVLDGTVSRIDLSVPSTGNDVDVLSETRIADGYVARTDPAALVIGPTGLAFDALKDRLYVASTGDNAIYAINNADETGPLSGKGQLIYKDNAHLRGPLALAIAPNGNLLTANGDAVNPDPMNKHNSEIIEFTPQGKFVNALSIDPKADGAFGIAVVENGETNTFAAVDDNTNQVDIWTFKDK